MKETNIGKSLKFVVTIAAVYAPIDINPACPNDNSPKNPVTKFNETASIIFIPIGIIKDLYCLLKTPELSNKYIKI